MSFFNKARIGAMSAFQVFRSGAIAGQVQLRDRSVPTQSFNYLGSGYHSDLAIVFIPGFASVPNAAAPGVISDAATDMQADFVRFYHPDLVDNPQRVTYDRMVADASHVVRSLPQRRVLLAGSSFGAGMMPLVASDVNDRQPGKVVGMFGWMSVPPAALLDLFKQQKGWADMQAGSSDQLKVVSPTMPKPFFMNRQQLESVERFAALAGHLHKFEGKAVFFSGAEDPVGKPQYTNQMLKQMHALAGQHEVLGVGHKIPPQEIERGLKAAVKAICLP